MAETVIQGERGKLVVMTPKKWAEVTHKVLQELERRLTVGESIEQPLKERLIAVAAEIRSPTLIVAEEAARLAGISAKRLMQLADEEFFPPAVKRKYDRDKFLCGMIQHLRGMIKRRSETSVDLDRSMKKKKDRLLEIELNAALGNSIPRETHDKILESIALTFRERALSIPGKASTRLPFCKGEKEMEDLLTKEIYDLLLSLGNPSLYSDDIRPERPKSTQPLSASAAN